MTAAGRIRDRRRFWSGALFLLIGLGALWNLPLPLGTLTDMGPGFFPMLLGAGLVLVGLLSMAAGALSAHRTGVEAVPWLPLLSVLAGVVAVGLMLTEWGLAAALLCLVGASCHARLRRHPLEVAVIYAVLLPLVWGIFVAGVQLPISLF